MLHHQKIETTSDGVTITGNATADGFRAGDNEKIILGTGSDFEIFHDGSNSIINDGGTGNLQLQAAGTTRIEVTTSGATVTGTLNATTDVQINGKGAATTGKAIAMAMVFG